MRHEIISYISPVSIVCEIGFVSDGEFNYMRSKGYTRPLSVLQMWSNARNKYSKIKKTTMLSMLTPKGM